MALAALRQLGARPEAHGRVQHWSLPNAEPEPPIPAPDFDGQELELRLADLAERAVGWSPQEYRYQLRKRFRLEASQEQVDRVLASLNGAVR